MRLTLQKKMRLIEFFFLSYIDSIRGEEKYNFYFMILELEL